MRMAAGGFSFRTVSPLGMTPVGSLFFDRRFSQMGNADRAPIFFIVGWRFLTRIGTSACFAAAGFPRIESRGITEDGRGLGSKLLDQLFNYIIVAH